MTMKNGERDREKEIDEDDDKVKHYKAQTHKK